ncbi:MAG: phosphotransferase [Acidobacteriota bacterium]
MTRRGTEEPIDAWAELRTIPGVAELPLPWTVRHAERLGLHASLRRFYRLTPGPHDPAEAATLVLVLYERDDAEAVDRYDRAARWFRAAGVRVPRVYGKSARALIVEDGGDRLLADIPGSADLVPRYAAAAETIVALQTRGLELEGPNPDLHLDEERLRWELDFTEQHALRGWLEAGPSRLRDDAFDRLAAAVARQPRRLCHRDYHSRNLLVDDGLMVLDFQDAMEGPLFYDLVSLLRDDYRDIPAAAAEHALQVFAEAATVNPEVAAVAEVPEEPESLPPGGRQGLALTGAQRSLKALGTFGYQVTVNKRQEYAAYGRRTWRHTRRALAALGWHDLIADLAPFDRL